MDNGLFDERLIVRYHRQPASPIATEHVPISRPAIHPHINLPATPSENRTGSITTHLSASSVPASASTRSIAVSTCALISSARRGVMVATARRSMGTWYGASEICGVKKTCGEAFSMLNQACRERVVSGAERSSGRWEGGRTMVEPEKRVGMRKGRLWIPCWWEC